MSSGDTSRKTYFENICIEGSQAPKKPKIIEVVLNGYHMNTYPQPDIPPRCHTNDNIFKAIFQHFALLFRVSVLFKGTFTLFNLVKL